MDFCKGRTPVSNELPHFAVGSNKKPAQVAALLSIGHPRVAFSILMVKQLQYLPIIMQLSAHCSQTSILLHIHFQYQKAVLLSMIYNLRKTIWRAPPMMYTEANGHLFLK